MRLIRTTASSTPGAQSWVDRIVDRADAKRAGMRHPAGDRVKEALIMKRGWFLLAVLLAGMAALSVGASVGAMAGTGDAATLLANGEVLDSGGERQCTKRRETMP